MTKTLIDKLEAHWYPAHRLENKYIPEPMSGCWLWIGGDNGDGDAETARITPGGSFTSTGQSTAELSAMAMGSGPNGAMFAQTSPSQLGGIAASAVGIAKILFVIFAVLAIASFLAGLLRRN